MGGVGGSASHALAGVGRAYTTVAGARSREEFLDGLRRGLTVPSGRSGTWGRLTAEVARIFALAYQDVLNEAARGTDVPKGLLALALVPFLPLIPLFTAGVLAHERRFGIRHFRAFQSTFGWPVERARPNAPLAAPLRLVG